ncbi:MAG: nicotinate-nucleotide--dimethylbenzimidazole phosphoribosyltransferase [Gordonia sp. (in: high G+C Gram-positive bacteria)]|uniref:nicotinate-nucleotide--dimethylbenzimidazole phosphoribosyltransferase n=1 Tax=Gordonia sp. (in: high G+C Gram-positive bacteria) TaxID=84139 RepID=UPI0039E6C46E
MGTPVGAENFPEITAPDPTATEDARERLASPDALGRLAEVAVWVAACQGSCPPRPITDPTLVVFGADDLAPSTTALAARAAAAIRTENPAASPDDGPVERARASVAYGRTVADSLVDGGADLLIAGDPVPDDPAAAVVIGTIAVKEPVEVVGTGGVDAAEWIARTTAVRDGMWRARGSTGLELLAVADSAGLAATAGFLAQAAVRRTPVVLDGTGATAAALVADGLAPGAGEWWLAGHVGADPAHAIALTRLGLTPLLDLGMASGGALAAVPLVAAATEILATGG